MNDSQEQPSPGLVLVPVDLSGKVSNDDRPTVITPEILTNFILLPAKTCGLCTEYTVADTQGGDPHPEHQEGQGGRRPANIRTA
jgi:hypothetical protein